MVIFPPMVMFVPVVNPTVTVPVLRVNGFLFVAVANAIALPEVSAPPSARVFPAVAT